MENNIRELNKLVAGYEQVADFTIYPTEFEKHPSGASSAILLAGSAEQKLKTKRTRHTISR